MFPYCFITEEEAQKRRQRIKDFVSKLKPKLPKMNLRMPTEENVARNASPRRPRPRSNSTEMRRLAQRQPGVSNYRLRHQLCSGAWRICIRFILLCFFHSLSLTMYCWINLDCLISMSSQRFFPPLPNAWNLHFLSTRKYETEDLCVTVDTVGIGFMKWYSTGLSNQVMKD